MVTIVTPRRPLALASLAAISLLRAVSSALPTTDQIISELGEIDLPDSGLSWSWKSAPDEMGQWWRANDKITETLDRYQNSSVFRFPLQTQYEQDSLSHGISELMPWLNVWDSTARYTDIQVDDPSRLSDLLDLLPDSLRSSHHVLVPNIARAIVESYPPLLSTETLAKADINLHKRQADVFFQDYQPLSTINSWIRFVESMYRDEGLVRIVNVGESYQGREILGLKVGMRSHRWDRDSSGGKRNTILITGGVHAREWISVSTVNFVAWSFIQSAKNDPMVGRILDEFDIVFIPVVNPDGYAYTWDGDRLWRKSRQPTASPTCPGFDLDHVFGFEWDHAEYGDDECSESFGGKAPFEAVEARRLADWIQNEAERESNFIAYLDLHSYSQQVLYPYEFACSENPPNLEKLQEVAFNLAKYMRLVNGEPYTVASACEAFAMRSNYGNRGGSVIDYIFHEFKAHYAYQIKLRDTGTYGFLLPSYNIVPTGKEVFQAMKYLGDYLLGNDGHESAESAVQVPSQDDQMELRRSTPAQT